MPSELDVLIEESLHLRQEVQKMQEQYDGKRGRILELMTADNRREYRYGQCKAVRTEAIILESVSKELFVKALQEVDIPREKKVFIWNKSIKEIKRPEMVILRTMGGTGRKEEEVMVVDGE
ncbi:MAG TPA: hypothetical protein VKF42_08350 [Chitinivibrionales bacterium]|jgi:hypothetical protein|nr:hypothetical protein [Chitinivibrionales bacterium]